MSFSFHWNLLTITEVLGLILAVIGFFNLSEKLEAMFRGVRKGCSRYASFKINNAKRFWPPHKNISALLVDMLQSLPFAIGWPLFALWLLDGINIFWDAFLGLSIFGRTMVVLAIILFLALNELFTHYVLNRIIAFIAYVFERLFFILGKPPSGVTGTLGMLLSLIAFGLGHFTASA